MSFDSFEGHAANGCSITRNKKENLPLTVVG